MPNDNANTDWREWGAKRIKELEAQVQQLQAEVVTQKAENQQLLKLTRGLDEHPDDYNGPCLCKLCVSYAN